MRNLVTIIIVTIILAGCGAPAPQAIDTFSRIVSVPGTYSTIGAAVNAAGDGWTINIQPGTYNERIVLSKSGVTLQAAAPGVQTKSIRVTGSNNVIRGFRIKDPASDWGLRSEGNNNLFENNEISNTKQDGVWFFGSGNIFRGNYIHDILDPSAAGTNGGDPHVDCFQSWDWSWNTENVVIENNICDHTRASLSNQIIMLSGSKTKNLTIRNNRFIMHDTGYSPVALYGGVGVTVENNYICNTTGKGQHAIYISGASGVIATGNTWAGYSSLLYGKPAAQSGNIKGALPCVIFPDASPTPTLTPAPASPTPQPSRTPECHYFESIKRDVCIPPENH
jgi:parallel beta-helix repeat protein